jgi:hypothetical protein
MTSNVAPEMMLENVSLRKQRIKNGGSKFKCVGAKWSLRFLIPSHLYIKSAEINKPRRNNNMRYTKKAELNYHKSVRRAGRRTLHWRRICISSL